jgi:ABC-type lipoprotein export system ATPase subunit
MTEYAITVKKLQHLYNTPTRRFLLQAVDLVIPMGGLLTILGESGSGKTTLQSRLGLLLALKSDEYSTVEEFRINERASPSRVVSHDVAELLKQGKAGKKRMEALRRRLMGFYLQSGELIPTLTIKENVAMPLRLNGASAKEANKRAEELLGYLLGVSDKNIPEKLPLEYSGGEYQRIALARAIAHRPQILFVDEPTSSLDTPNKRRVLDLMSRLACDEETTVVMINHDHALARSYSDYIVNISAIPEGWDDEIGLPFRESDGFGTPISFEAKIDGSWFPTNSHFQVDYTPSHEEYHVA